MLVGRTVVGVALALAAEEGQVAPITYHLLFAVVHQLSHVPGAARQALMRRDASDASDLELGPQDEQCAREESNDGHQLIPAADAPLPVHHLRTVKLRQRLGEVWRRCDPERAAHELYSQCKMKGGRIHDGWWWWRSPPPLPAKTRSQKSTTSSKCSGFMRCGGVSASSGTGSHMLLSVAARDADTESSGTLLSCVAVRLTDAGRLTVGALLGEQVALDGRENRATTTIPSTAVHPCTT